jgi:hypothetical protein
MTWNIKIIMTWVLMERRWNDRPWRSWHGVDSNEDLTSSTHNGQTGISGL